MVWKISLFYGQYITSCALFPCHYSISLYTPATSNNTNYNNTVDMILMFTPTGQNLTSDRKRRKTRRGSQRDSQIEHTDYPSRSLKVRHPSSPLITGTQIDQQLAERGATWKQVVTEEADVSTSPPSWTSTSFRASPHVPTSVVEMPRVAQGGVQHTLAGNSSKGHGREHGAETLSDVVCHQHVHVLLQMPLRITFSHVLYSELLRCHRVLFLQ